MRKFITKHIPASQFISVGKCLILFMIIFSFAACTEYTKVLKSRDADYKFEYAKKAYDQKKYQQAITLLGDVIQPLRGSEKGEEALFLLGMSHYENKDYMNSGVYFKTYYTRYPKGKYAELARYYSGYGYYLDSPDLPYKIAKEAAAQAYLAISGGCEQHEIIIPVELLTKANVARYGTDRWQ